MSVEGTYTAVSTLHRDDGSIDDGALFARIECLVDLGTHGLINCGSTGEYYAQNLRERRKVVSLIEDVIRTVGL